MHIKKLKDSNKNALTFEVVKFLATKGMPAYFILFITIYFMVGASHYYSQ